MHELRLSHGGTRIIRRVSLSRRALKRYLDFCPDGRRICIFLDLSPVGIISLGPIQIYILVSLPDFLTT